MMQQSLTDLVSTLRAGMHGSASSSGSQRTPQGMTTTPDYAPPGMISGQGMTGSMGAMGFLPSGSSPSSLDPALSNHGPYRSASVGSGPTPPFYAQPASGNMITTQRSPSGSMMPFGGLGGVGVIGSSAGQTAPSPMTYAPNQLSPFASTSASANRTSPSAFPLSSSGADAASARRPGQAGPTQSFAWPNDPRMPGSSSSTAGANPTMLPPATAQDASSKGSRATRHDSLPPSRAGSVGPEDILAPEEIINPLGAMSNMAGLVEAAVERAKEEQALTEAGSAQTPAGKTGDAKRRNSESGDKPAGAGAAGAAGAVAEVGQAGGAGRPLKKARFSPPSGSGPVVLEAQNLPPVAAPSGGAKAKTRSHRHAYPDVIGEGYVTEEEGKHLMSM